MIIDHLSDYQFEIPKNFDLVIKSIGYVVWNNKQAYILHVLPTKEFLIGKHNGTSVIILNYKNNFLIDMSTKPYDYYFEDIIFKKKQYLGSLYSTTIKIQTMYPHYPGLAKGLHNLPIVKYKFDPNRKIDEPKIHRDKDFYYVTHNFIKSILAIYKIFPNQFLEFFDYSFDELMEYLKIKKNSEMYKQLLVHTITKRLIEK
jgi:hypothetical protein